ncbi:hypothetical protein [Promicromonospora sp. NPDC060271]|uniref:hypothetical protein n=1 Tax=Promicromonospora sp. NPDC060271 TaxID=3347089 RepID=UPI00365C0D9C
MTETAKFYTKARRIPMLVGKLPSGGRIWGGPYTITQVGAGAVVAFALWQTAPLWARLGGLMNIVVAVGVVVGVVWATGKLPSSGRNPVAFVMDAMNLTTSPGRLSGGQVALPKPRLITHRVMVVLPRQTGATSRAEMAAGQLRPAAGVRAGAVEPQPPAVARPISTELLPELTGPGPWAAAAAAAAAGRKNTDLTGVGQLLAGRPQDTDRTAPTTPRED